MVTSRFGPATRMPPSNSKTGPGVLASAGLTEATDYHPAGIRPSKMNQTRRPSGSSTTMKCAGAPASSPPFSPNVVGVGIRQRPSTYNVSWASDSPMSPTIVPSSFVDQVGRA